MKYETLNQLNEIKFKLHIGIISYDEAKKRAEPLLKIMNDKSIEIAKRLNVKPKKFTFSSFMR
jgi:hypothetical protein